jgi:hypothetical protein
MSAALIRTIQVGCKHLGIDQDTRRELQLQLVGKPSLSDMTDAERQKVLAELRARGFKPTARRGHKPAPRSDLRLIHVLWAKLGEAGELENPTRKGLNTFIRRRFGETWQSVPRDVDDLREFAQIDAVLQALMAWGRRAGIDFDWARIGK